MITVYLEMGSHDSELCPAVLPSLVSGLCVGTRPDLNSNVRFFLLHAATLNTAKCFDYYERRENADTLIRDFPEL